MKKIKRVRILAALLVFAFCITGCSKGKDDEPAAVTKEEQKPGETENAKQEDDKKQETDATQEKDKDNNNVKPDINTEPSFDEVRIIVFYGNEDATAFVKEEMAIKSLSQRAVLQALVDKGVVPADVSVLDFKTTEVDGKSSIEIDFNNAFSTYIKSMGSTGEYYTVGGVCNTFLNAYNCSQIKITVEGSALTTGHAEYPGYMTMFE